MVTLRDQDGTLKHDGVGLRLATEPLPSRSSACD